MKKEFILYEETIPAGSQVGEVRADPEVVAHAPLEREPRLDGTKSGCEGSRSWRRKSG